MGKIRFDPEKPLYDGHKIAWTINQCPAAMDKLIALAKPIVVFVHGRGKEPNKSLNGATFVKGLAVPKIELGYDVSVLMFNWDSAFPGLSFNDRTRALSHVPAAAQAFAELLQALNTYFVDKPTQSRPTLLVHSMGSIVVQRVMEGNAWPRGPALFRQIVLTQPDADDVGHAVWLDPLCQQELVFVTLNNDDKVLRRSTDERAERRHALGLGTSEPLASNCKYIDLTNMGAIGSAKDDDHEVFGKGAMNGQVYVCQFFEQALRGENVVLDRNLNVESVDRNVVFRLKSKNDPTAPCLKQPPLPRSD
jgi:esterase/lipase superfamily enzyme